MNRNRMFMTLLTAALTTAIWTAPALAVDEKAAETKPKITQEETKPVPPIPSSTKDEATVVRPTATDVKPKTTFGVSNDVWVDNLKLIPEVKEPVALMEKVDKKQDAWYLADMIAMKSPQTDSVKSSSIYRYHKRALDTLKINPPALASTSEIALNPVEAAGMVDVLHYAIKEKGDLTDEEMADILVYGSGMVSRGITTGTVRQMAVAQLRSGRTVTMLLNDMLDRTPRKPLGQK